MIRNKRVVTADLHLLRLTGYPFTFFDRCPLMTVQLKKGEIINNRLNER